MNEKRFTSFIEDDGYWIRDESDFKIIATGLKFGVAENLIAMLNEQQSIINKIQEEKIELLKKVFLFEKGIAIHLQKEEQMELYTYVDLEMKR